MPEKKRGLSILKNEDWMAVWLGFLIIALVLLGVQVRMPTFKWTTDAEFKTLITTTTPAVDGLVTSAAEKGEADLAAAATGLKTAMGTGERKAIGDAAKKLAAVKPKDAGLEARGGGMSKEVS